MRAKMAERRVLLILLTLSIVFNSIDAKVFTRCQLTRELLKINFQRTFLSNWVCLIEQESDRNTAALVTKSARRKYYGLYQLQKALEQIQECCATHEQALQRIQDLKQQLQELESKTNSSVTSKYCFTNAGNNIGSEWCKEGKKGGKCDITCEALLDDDIRDDSACALKVFELEGFKYWTKWESRCKGKLLPDIEKCAEWQYPPSRSSVSPSRDKRRIRRSLRSKYFTFLSLMHQARAN